MNNLFVDGVVQDEKTYNERTNLANEIIAALFGAAYIKAGQSKNLAQAIRDGKGLAELADYLDLNALLGTGFSMSRDYVLTQAIGNAGGLVTDASQILAKIQDSGATVSAFVPYVNVSGLVAALGITKDDVQTAYNNNSSVVKSGDEVTVAMMFLNGNENVNDYLPYLNVDILLDELYGEDAKDTVALQILTGSGLVKSGSEATVLNYIKDSTKTTADYIPHVQMSDLLTTLGITYVDIYEKLLKDVDDDASALIKSGKKHDAAVIINDNKSNFKNLSALRWRKARRLWTTRLSPLFRTL